MKLSINLQMMVKMRKKVTFWKRLKNSLKIMIRHWKCNTMIAQSVTILSMDMKS